MQANVRAPVYDYHSDKFRGLKLLFLVKIFMRFSFLSFTLDVNICDGANKYQ